MKPKRKPVFLITLLVTAVVVVAGLNMTNVLDSENQLKNVESPNAEALKKALDREKSKSTNVGNYGSLEQLKKQGEEQPITGATIYGLKNEVPPTPSIEIPQNKVEAPKYKPGRTAGQWYDSDSYENKRVEDRGQ